ncbi:acyl transferase/acyl hydrolase/lysophospholipase [Desarmillaria tabescens]|uniref:Acyl transferase/acyl hydrolase/lysophospholipase n=1 Tax=Armillaria tabescens TaxID=1929756 RepID=A0AA39NRA5_ARMTA|nr:acyl transferase/acyl hydrolase/lysophospholipase [Desarmillaria tabescens]KAK0470078.1 acyl transferase/acyl hydrolase/lysophospholipase [Desarmillaria tabescens]
MSAPETATKFAPTQSPSVLGGQIVGRTPREAAPPAALKLRLDLNLEVEIAIQAKVNGDITLSLLRIKDDIDDAESRGVLPNFGPKPNLANWVATSTFQLLLLCDGHIRRRAKPLRTPIAEEAWGIGVVLPWRLGGGLLDKMTAACRTTNCVFVELVGAIFSILRESIDTASGFRDPEAQSIRMAVSKRRIFRVTRSSSSYSISIGPSTLNDLPLNLLSLDGGGIRGLSELFILDEIMKRIQVHKNLQDTPKPCEYFDLIGGTSTGGLIAIMLGRLKMSTAEALQCYKKLFSIVFNAENRKAFYSNDKFKATALEKEMKRVIVQAGYSEDQKLLDPDAGRNSKGNAFVCAMTEINLRSPQRFRTYPGLPNQGPDCKIWEAARATTATPTLFKAIKIGPGNFGSRYVDANLRFNNPTKEVRDEAKELFGSNRYIGVLVSIGTGHTGPSGLRQRKGIEKFLPLKLIRVLQHIATDCESVADELAKEYGGDGAYFRFNVLHGTEGIYLDEWEKMSELSAHTTSYLRGQVSTQIDRFIVCLLQKKTEDLAVPLVDRSSIFRIEKELVIGDNFRIHSGELTDGKVVIVKVFEGEHAAQNCRATANQEFKVLNVQFPRTDTLYNVQESAALFIANAIPSSAQACFIAGATFSALDYLCACDIPFHCIGVKDFAVFMSGTNTVALSFNVCQNSSLTSSPSSLNDTAFDIFGGLCFQASSFWRFLSSTFNTASKLLYNDHFVHDNDDPELSDTTQAEISPNLDNNNSSYATDAETSVSSSRPRREIIWRRPVTQSAGITLKSVSQEYKFVLESLSISPFKPLNHIVHTGTGVYRTVHRCQGYRREEVTLRPVPLDSKVIMRATPSLHEKCLICGEDVEEGIFSCKCGLPDDRTSPNVKCTKCSVWGHSHCNDEFNYICWRCGQRRHYRTELNNFILQAGWVLQFEDTFVGPQRGGTWTSTAYVNGVAYGKGMASKVGDAREQASYEVLVHFGRA